MLDSGMTPLQISDTMRVKVYYDEDSHSLDFIVGDTLGVYFIRPTRDYDRHNQGDYTDQLATLQYKVRRDSEQSALGKYLALAGMNYKFVSLQGYSQSDWAEVVIYTDEGYDLESSAKALDTWFKGDIFIVCLEQLHTYTEHSTGQTIERWEVEDSIGAITLSDDYTLETVANDYFTNQPTNITKEMTK